MFKCIYRYNITILVICKRPLKILLRKKKSLWSTFQPHSEQYPVIMTKHIHKNNYICENIKHNIQIIETLQCGGIEYR